MTNQEEISAIKARIAKSESDTRTWRVSGYRESSVEAYDDAQAEELQLEAKLAQSGAALEKNRPPVFRSLTALTSATVGATDGPIGTVSSALFDDKSWAIRYLVVDTGTWLSERQVLLSPYAVMTPWSGDRSISVALTQQQVRSSPDIDTHQPVTRQHEREHLRHYEYPEYWEGGGLWATAAYPVWRTHVPSTTETEVENDPYIAQYIHPKKEYKVKLKDADKDFIFDEASWAIRYFVVDTRNWWPGGKLVLVARHWIDRIDWAARIVRIKLTREQVMNSPAYDDATTIDRNYEQRLCDAHKRQGYWD